MIISLERLPKQLPTLLFTFVNLHHVPNWKLSFGPVLEKIVITVMEIFLRIKGNISVLSLCHYWSVETEVDV